jgi:hypothetical protein
MDHTVIDVCLSPFKSGHEGRNEQRQQQAETQPTGAGWLQSIDDQRGAATNHESENRRGQG